VCVIVSGLTGFDCVVGDRDLPEFEPLSPSLRALANRRLNISEIPINKSSQERWKYLKETLLILEKTNSVVESWVRYHYSNGTLIFVDSEGHDLFEENIKQPVAYGILAKYDYISDKLYIGTSFYNEKLGHRAALLCHEFRHSRQNVGKYSRYVFSFLFFKEGKPEIIENDAYLYESQAEEAIFGETGNPNGVTYDST
jgi:hypothetical protein